jgi:hypothetical protein
MAIVCFFENVVPACASTLRHTPEKRRWLSSPTWEYEISYNVAVLKFNSSFRRRLCNWVKVCNFSLWWITSWILAIKRNEKLRIVFIWDNCFCHGDTYRCNFPEICRRRRVIICFLNRVSSLHHLYLAETKRRNWKCENRVKKNAMEFRLSQHSCKQTGEYHDKREVRIGYEVFCRLMTRTFVYYENNTSTWRVRPFYARDKSTCTYLSVFSFAPLVKYTRSGKLIYNYAKPVPCLGLLRAQQHRFIASNDKWYAVYEMWTATRLEGKAVVWMPNVFMETPENLNHFSNYQTSGYEA